MTCPKKEESPFQSENDFFLQHSPDRACVYRSSVGMRWSGQLCRWLVFEPTTISSILKDENFRTPTYDVSPLENRFGINLSYTKRICSSLPLAFEGAEHQRLRMLYGQIITQNFQEAVETFRGGFSKCLTLLRERRTPLTFCLMDDLLKGPLRATLMTLAGLRHAEHAAADKLEIIPLHFDDATSIKKRLEIEEVLKHLYERNASPGEDMQMLAVRCGIVMVSANTLLGSILHSIVNTLADNQGKPLSKSGWSDELPWTGLPLIERVCIRDTTIGESSIQAGQRVRLYLESSTVQSDGTSRYSDLLFATGPHKCIGMSISRLIWKIVVDMLSSIDERWLIESAVMRRDDHVFNFYERVMVTIDG